MSIYRLSSALRLAVSVMAVCLSFFTTSAEGVEYSIGLKANFTRLSEEWSSRKPGGGIGYKAEFSIVGGERLSFCGVTGIDALLKCHSEEKVGTLRRVVLQVPIYAQLKCNFHEQSGVFFSVGPHIGVGIVGNTVHTNGGYMNYLSDMSGVKRMDVGLDIRCGAYTERIIVELGLEALTNPRYTWNDDSRASSFFVGLGFKF